jgi:hypothetical protein
MSKQGYKSEPSNAPTVLDLQRQREILFDISMDLGVTWRTIDIKTREAMMDKINGSRGLFEHVLRWVEEFDREWESSERDPNKDYMESVADFTMNKLSEMIEAARGYVGSEAVQKVKKTYLARFDEHARKIAAMEGMRFILTEKERAWLFTARTIMVMEPDLEKVLYMVRCCNVLVGKVIKAMHNEGFTYTALGKAVGITGSRLREIERRYERTERSDKMRVEHGGVTNMPWAD